MGDRSPCGSDTGFVLGGSFSGESPVCINQGPNPPSSAFQTVTPLSLGTSRPESMAQMKGVRWQVGGGLGLRAQPDDLSPDTALNMLPPASVSSQTPSAGLRDTCPGQPAFSVLTSISLGSLTCSWVNRLGIGGGEPWSRGPDHTHHPPHF